MAQTLTAVRERANRKGGASKDDFLAIEIHELDRRNPWPDHDLIPDSKKLPPPFDFERTIRFMSYGFLMSPIQHRWFGFLSSTFPITKIGSPWVPALKRVAFDQLIFAPAGLAAFFTYMTIAEGGGRRAVQRKFQDVYIPALKANFLIWPTVQIINFRIMPIQFQIVSQLTPNLLCLLTTRLALCFHRRYCLDSIPFPDQLRRGSLDVSSSNDFPCTCSLGSHTVGSWPWSRHCGIPLKFSSERFCIGSVGKTFWRSGISAAFCLSAPWGAYACLPGSFVLDRNYIILYLTMRALRQNCVILPYRAVDLLIWHLQEYLLSSLPELPAVAIYFCADLLTFPDAS